jgi:hypothetical protein
MMFLFKPKVGRHLSTLKLESRYPVANETVASWHMAVSRNNEIKYVP